MTYLQMTPGQRIKRNLLRYMVVEALNDLCCVFYAVNSRLHFYRMSGRKNSMAWYLTKQAIKEEIQWELLCAECI